MYDIIDALDSWNRSAERVVVARTIALHGFGARTANEALAIAASGTTAGSLLGGTATAQLRREVAGMLDDTRPASRTSQVEIGNDKAVEAGFACGGSADVMLQTVDLLPVVAFDAFRSAKPFVVASVLGTPAVMAVDAEGVTHGELTTAALQDAAVEQAKQLLAGGGAASKLVLHEDGDLFIECFVPTTRLLVVGEGILADALAAQAKLLGWEPEILGDDQHACEQSIRHMRGSDVLVLLTHNFGIDAPILGAAIQQGVGYVGALGSRMNQAKRRERLEAFGLSSEELARFRGPIGLDIGATNPAETALAICAEAVAVLHRRAAAPLTGTSSSLNG